MRSPHLLLRPVEQGYFYAVNPNYPHSLRLLTGIQAEIMAAIDGRVTVSALNERFSVPLPILEEFLGLLSRTEIIRFDNRFSSPEKPEAPDALNFWIHTTNRCNLTCGYCYIPTLHKPEGMSEATRQQLVKKLADTVERRQIKHVKFRLAGGEPLTQFKTWRDLLPEIRKQLEERGCRFDASFVTNLTILTEEILAFSAEHDLSFGVSLDGIEEVHDRTRKFRSGASSFSLVDANLRRLLAKQVPVFVNTVVSNENIDGLPALTHYLVDLDVPFRYSVVRGEAIDEERLEEGLSASFQIMEDAIRRGWAFSRRHQFCDLKPMELGFQTCASGFSGGAIYVDGTLNYCHVHFGDTDKVPYSIFDNERDLVDMIEQGSHEEDSRSKECLSCRYSSVCTSGCPVYRVNGKDPQCTLYHKLIPKIYDLQALERLMRLRRLNSVNG